MKLIVISIILLFCTYLYADEIIINKEGESILLKDDFTWELLDDDNTTNAVSILELNYQGILISIEAAKIINTYHGQEAGLKFRIQNNSDKIVNKLRLIVYFINNEGLTFFEKEYLVVNADATFDSTILKPNYIILCPSKSSEYKTAEGLALVEWDEGKIWFEVSEIIYADSEE